MNRQSPSKDTFRINEHVGSWVEKYTAGITVFAGK